MKSLNRGAERSARRHATVILGAALLIALLVGPSSSRGFAFFPRPAASDQQVADHGELPGANRLFMIGQTGSSTDGPKKSAPPATKPTNSLRPKGATGPAGTSLQTPDGKAVPPTKNSTTKNSASKSGETTAPPKTAAGGTAQIRLFEGWPQPELALVVTGRQNGYIEPCGCTGLANQKGGLARRETLLKELRQDRRWPVVALDVGNQVKRFGRQSEIKFQVAFEGLKAMDYQAIGLGPDDLRLSSGELFSAISDEPGRFVASNVAVLERDLTPRSKVIPAGGRKIGVTAVLGEDYRRKLMLDEISTEAPDVGIKAALKQLSTQRCDLQVLLAYTSLDESRKLAQQFPQFQIIVTTGGAEEPAFEPEQVAGTSTWLIQVGAKGMYVGVIGVFADKKQPLRYQRVPLDDRFADSPAMLKLLGAYQDQLREVGLDGLGPKPAVHPSGRTFVGSQACADCHTKAFAVWQKSAHAHATDSLVKPKERAEIARHHDPECLSCHVTGWEPQKYYPYKSGYLGLESTPHARQNGCENCHGPGSAHVATENGDVKASDAMRDRLRAEMRLPLAKARDKCLECHDLDNSPAFQKDGAFEKYWQEIAHPGKD